MTTNPKKKSDPVRRFQNMQNQWQKSSFLKASGGTNNKQGRKLELDRFHKWSSLVHQHNQQTTRYVSLDLPKLLSIAKRGKSTNSSRIRRHRLMTVETICVSNSALKSLKRTTSIDRWRLFTTTRRSSEGQAPDRLKRISCREILTQQCLQVKVAVRIS